MIMMSREKYRIAILGIGGVGGFIGGKLALAYHSSPDIDLIFIARGENKKQILRNGLRLITDRKEFICRPSLVSDDPEEIGMIHLLICCVKSYDLAESILKYRSCINNDTAIITLVNGLEAASVIRNIISVGRIWQGFIYVNSRLRVPGEVVEESNAHSIYFGNAHRTEEAEKLRLMLVTAGLEAVVPENILEKMWEKYLFISPIATVTTYLNSTIAEVIRNGESRAMLQQLFEEVSTVGKEMGIDIPGVEAKFWDKAESMPLDATSSMHRDLRNGKRLEISSLTGYVIQQGDRLGVDTPMYDKIYNSLTTAP